MTNVSGWSRLCAALVITLLPILLHATGKPSTDEADARSAIEQFEAGLQKRDVKSIEAVAAEDIVAFENGYRNDGWKDFRDNHLLPELRETAPPGKTALIRFKASDSMAWGYSRTDMELQRRGQRIQATLWTVYILEKRADGWKIVSLDWSMKAD